MESASRDASTVPLMRYFDSRGQSAGAQVDREVRGLLATSGAANLSGVANDLFNDRNAENLLVEHERRTFADVGPGVLLEARGRILAQRERSDRLLHGAGSHPERRADPCHAPWVGQQLDTTCASRPPPAWWLVTYRCKAGCLRCTLDVRASSTR